MNRVLVSGLILVFLLVALAVIGPVIAPYAPDYSENFYYEETEAGQLLMVSPVPPSSRHLLGTDPYGYDVLTLMLYGLRYTLGLTMLGAALRVFFGLLLALFTFRRKEHSSHSFAGVLHLPVFLLIYFIFCQIVFNSRYSPFLLGLFQCGMIVVFGVGPIMSMFRKEIRHIADSDFVEAAISCGAGERWIVFRHILPCLGEKIILNFFQEMVLVLVIFAQLGIFSMFIGGSHLTPYPTIISSVTHEWAGLIGQYYGRLQGSSGFLAYTAIGGYILVLVSFYLLSSGMERELRRRYRR